MFKHVINTRSHDDANTIIHIHKGALPFDVNFILSATNPQAA